jgi:Uma2 family endonuclease
MQWADVLADPTLRDLPYKIELNEYGKIVMTPASNRHGSMQVEIALRLSRVGGDGKVIAECSVQTRLGVKVADVVWCSSEFMGRHGLETPYAEAPEICVEIVAPSSSDEEMAGKRRLYFERGAKEVWVVSEEGVVRVFGPDGALPESRLVVE